MLGLESNRDRQDSLRYTGEDPSQVLLRKESQWIYQLGSLSMDLMKTFCLQVSHKVLKPFYIIIYIFNIFFIFFFLCTIIRGLSFFFFLVPFRLLNVKFLVFFFFLTSFFGLSFWFFRRLIAPFYSILSYVNFFFSVLNILCFV